MSFELFSRRLVVLIAAGTVWAGLPVRAAQLTYTTQSRSVTAAPLNTLTQSASAPDFGTFDVTLSPSGGVGDTVTATQRSQLLPNGVTFASRLSGERTNRSSSANISGRSLLETAFTLDVASPYSFYLNRTQGPSLNGYLVTTLRNEATGTTVFQQVIDPLTSSSSLTSFGTLTAGPYRLFMTHSDNTTMMISGFTTAYNATLIVPEPASLGLAAVGGGLLARRRRRAGNAAG